jgi:hypothetical protein
MGWSEEDEELDEDLQGGHAADEIENRRRQILGEDAYN